MAKKYVRICPECKSADIGIDKSTLQMTGALPTLYICNKCSYSNYSFPEVKVEELDNLKDEIKNNPKDKSTKKRDLIDTSYGKFFDQFVVRIWWKIVSPLFILFGVFLIYRVDIFTGVIITLFGIGTGYISYYKLSK